MTGRPLGRVAPPGLLVVESPTVALTLRRWLGPGWSVLATGGHLLDLPRRREGIDLAGGFEPTWELVRGKGRTLSDLKRAARRARQVLLATDPDREGEAIAWQLAVELGADEGSGRIRRALLPELTPQAVARAVANPMALDRARAEAQLARRLIDRLIGFRLSARLSSALSPGLSAGRVQVAALRLAAGWRADAVSAAGAPELPGPVAPPPFQTVTLLQAAARQLGFRPRKTMALAQALYEGVVLEDGERTGLLTYPRTGSTWIAGMVDEGVRELVRARHGPAALAPAPVDAAGSASTGGHEALRPARLDWPPERVRELLRQVGGRDLPRLYELAWDRLLASRMTVEAGLARSTRRAAPGVRTLSPARLDDATFLGLLVGNGLGRPSTLATIAESLEARGYLDRAGGALVVTPLGRRVVAWLDRTFPGTLDAPFTATLEARLDDVEQGRVPWRAAVAGIWTPLERPLGRVVA